MVCAAGGIGIAVLRSKERLFVCNECADQPERYNTECGHLSA